MNSTIDTSTPRVPFTANEKVILTVYILQLVGFLFPLLWIVGVIINYVKRSDLETTWLISHNRWQIRTFWFSLLWYVVGSILLLIVIGYAVLVLNSLWLLYRCIKGLIYLYDRKDVYYPNLSHTGGQGSTT